MKQGNSLIGARIREVEDYLSINEAENYHLFATSEFAGVMLATDLMRQVSYLSDNTVSQVDASRTAYLSAADHLAPFKRMLDVYTSRWFSNAKIAKGKTDYVRLFLKQEDVKPWLKDPSRALDTRLIPASQIGSAALADSEAKQFFQWQLEFPEVFFAPSRPGDRMYTCGMMAGLTQ